MIELMQMLFRLKDEERAGWVLRGIDRPESVADHSWGTALLCLLHAAKAGVNRERAVAMALIHDVAEVVTGDVPARVGDDGKVHHASGKVEREREALDLLFPSSAREFGDIRDLWLEYEENQSPVALFVRDMNLVEMCTQALIYEEGRRYDPLVKAGNFPRFRRLDEFFATSTLRIATEVGRALLEQLYARYRAREE